MAIYEVGSFLFEANQNQKTISLSRTYNNPITVTLTPVNENINIYLTDIANNYFVVEKNFSSEVNIKYVVIESEV
jgi:hypothetical protein